MTSEHEGDEIWVSTGGRKRAPEASPRAAVCLLVRPVTEGQMPVRAIGLGCDGSARQKAKVELGLAIRNVAGKAGLPPVVRVSMQAYDLAEYDPRAF
ncbi:uncharacterized protein L969DRAFT_96530 [Mixia osmundae IAM 14324]|uniref:Uncharacterized protein n=1 Tax=Mixia osmundae (strain CBS 9802 / IAM 14324 / JCM 22182 / KY 12970) TaxID=764103 RepID=G7DUS1_MIXOS|nr:uncharacterized protein L969DRAFT_96530 [Mixia osmundae IAM 14324]KEI37451.1 hypothetical protein L969DRAFT_96530 [Mixia osmundae IAM 14324]GAA94331.1 hypothetical protein E5Q_00982 [Mixia osmundae IAM 14324]